MILSLCKLQLKLSEKADATTLLVAKLTVLVALVQLDFRQMCVVIKHDETSSNKIG